MKKAPNTTGSAVIAEAKTHFSATQAALRKSCESALLTGVRLIWQYLP